MRASDVERYRQYAKTCQDTDYGKPDSVRAHNRAVTSMYKTVEKAAAEGNQAIQALAILLDEPITREWLAFQLLDKGCDVPPDLEQKCLQIIQGIANDPSRYADAFASREWLKRWEQKHQSSSR